MTSSVLHVLDMTVPITSDGNGFNTSLLWFQVLQRFCQGLVSKPLYEESVLNLENM